MEFSIDLLEDSALVAYAKTYLFTEGAFMNLSRVVVLVLFLTFISVPAFAKNIEIPESGPVVSVNIPESWEPENTERGVACESPDKVATIFFEIANSEKAVNALIDENFDWLVNDQKVKINSGSQQEKEAEIAGAQWKVLTWDADSAEWGAAKVGMLMTSAGKNKLLIATYWITKKDADKHDATLTKIFESVKMLKE